MEAKSNFIGPYKSSNLHAIYHSIDQLPGPYWLFSLAFVLFTGILNHMVAWNENVLAPGEINWDFATTGFQCGFLLFGTDFLFRVAKNSLLEFRPMLNVSEDEFNRILFEFTRLPARNTLVIFLVGAVIGTALGIYLLPIAPEMNFAFPEMEIPLYTLSFGIAFIFIYMVARTIGLINRLFERVEKVDIFDQNSIYAISRYSAWLIVIVSIPVSVTTVNSPTFTSITDFYFLSTMIILYFMLFVLFWLPLRGINRTLILEKRRLLIEVNRRIKTIFSLIHSRVDSQTFEKIADLKEALEGLKIEKEVIELLHTAPWKPSTITGLTTAVFLPLLVGLLTNLVTWILNF